MSGEFNVSKADSIGTNNLDSLGYSKILSPKAENSIFVKQHSLNTVKNGQKKLELGLKSEKLALEIEKLKPGSSEYNKFMAEFNQIGNEMNELEAKIISEQNQVNFFIDSSKEADAVEEEEQGRANKSAPE